VTQEYQKTEEFGSFHHFETITLCPHDTEPIVKKLLTKKETRWLKQLSQNGVQQAQKASEQRRESLAQK